MNELTKGNITLKMIPSTGQFYLYQGQGRNIESESWEDANQQVAQDIISVMKAYLNLRPKQKKVTK